MSRSQPSEPVVSDRYKSQGRNRPAARAWEHDRGATCATFYAPLDVARSRSGRRSLTSGVVGVVTGVLLSSDDWSWLLPPCGTRGRFPSDRTGVQVDSGLHGGARPGCSNQHCAMSRRPRARQEPAAASIRRLPRTWASFPQPPGPYSSPPRRRWAPTAPQWERFAAMFGRAHLARKLRGLAEGPREHEGSW